MTTTTTDAAEQAIAPAPEATTLDGRPAHYTVVYADGATIPDAYGDRGQYCETIEDAEELAEQHRAAGSDVIVRAIAATAALR